MNILYSYMMIVTVLISCVFTHSAMAADVGLVADLVIVGGGSAGLSAAVAGAQQGAKVIVLEKNPFLGGSSNFAEGLFGAETRYQKAKSYELTKDEAFKHVAEFGHYKVDLALFRQFINDSSANLDWLAEQGIDFEAIQISPTEPIAWHIIKDRGRFRHGSALVTALQQKAEALGVQFLMRTPATKLLTSSGRVVGVEGLNHKGDVVNVAAKAVIIATGGFGNSPEKIEQWTDYDPQRFKPTLPLNKTGDGIQMAKDVGAITRGENLMLHPGTEGAGIIPLGGIYTMTWQPNNLWVNKLGQRFTDEYVAYSFAQAGNAIAFQPESFAWAIFDDALVSYAESEGVDNGVGVIVTVATKLTGLREEIKHALAADSDSFKAADTIEELAAQMAVPVKPLKETFENYNTYAEHLYDQQFAKEHRYLKRLTHGKLYAVKVFPYHFVSIGGVRVNTKMQALDGEYKHIPGLYIGGMDVGGLYGDTYALWASGNAFGFSTYSGRMAAINALNDMQ